MWTKTDVEEEARPLYPMMLESPELRWSFIRKIYSIICIQLFATIAVAATVVSIPLIVHFFANASAGLALYVFLVITTFVTLCPLYSYSQKHPVNYIPLGIYTISLAFAIGLVCAFTSKVILEAVILCTVVVVSLTLFTFWAAKKGLDFNFLGPFLFGALMVLVVFALIQDLYDDLYGCLASLLHCAYIVYDTDNLIKRYTYDEYIWAAVTLYVDIISLFLSLLTIFRGSRDGKRARVKVKLPYPRLASDGEG